MAKTNSKHFLILLGTAVIATGCGNSNDGYFKASVSEIAALKSSVFSSSSAPAYSISTTGSGTEVDSQEDSTLPGEPFAKKCGDGPCDTNIAAACNLLAESRGSEAVQKYVEDIAGDSGVLPGVGPYANIANSREFEKAVVEKKVKDRLDAIKRGEKLPMLIPVEYVFTTGDKHDGVSYLAYTRSILRDDHSGKTIINSSNVGHVSYTVDNEEARNDFALGKMRHFSLVEVIKKNSTDLNVVFGPMITENKIPNLSAWNVQQAHVVSGAPFGADYLQNYIATGKTPIAPIILADLRAQTVPLLKDIHFMYPDVSAVGRNNEVVRQLKDTFNMKEIFRNSSKIIAAFAENRNVDGLSYKPYSGMSHVLQRMKCDTLSAKLTTTLYTPIVLDLGDKNVRTSSLDWGSYFNLAAGQTFINGVAQAQEGENTYNHRTAWVGGKLQKIPNPLDPAKPELWARVADDGLLVLPKDGKVETSEQLFGSFFKNPSKPDAKYANGFEAFQDLYGSTEACKTKPIITIDSRDDKVALQAKYLLIKERYLGPWSPLYDQLKVWVDADRNGEAAPEELKSLAEANVAAINTCLLSESNKSEVDAFGNSTKLRTAFLLSPVLARTPEVEEEILNEIATGKKKDGLVAEFRLAVDIFFVSAPREFLERTLAYRAQKSGKPHDIQIQGVSLQDAEYAGEIHTDLIIKK